MSPSYARDWKENEIKRSEKHNIRRAEEIAKAKIEQEARDKARRIYYEQKRKKGIHITQSQNFPSDLKAGGDSCIYSKPVKILTPSIASLA